MLWNLQIMAMVDVENCNNMAGKASFGMARLGLSRLGKAC